MTKVIITNLTVEKILTLKGISLVACSANVCAKRNMSSTPRPRARNGMICN